MKPYGVGERLRVSMEWLTEQSSVSELESGRWGREMFARDNPRWRAFKSKLQPGDQVWRFSTPGRTWRNKMGRAGVALVRGGKVLEAYVTLRN